MAEVPSDRSLVEGVREDLHGVRDRGLDRLDLDTKKQPRKPVPYLEPLAFAFCAAMGIPAYGRIAAIDILLRHALAAYAECGNRTAQEVIDEVLFDPPGVGPQVPLDRMEQARDKRNEKRKSKLAPPEFTAYVSGVIDQFAPFLTDYATAAIRHAEAQQLPQSTVMLPLPAAPAAPTPSDTSSPQRTRWVAVALVGLVIAGLVLARWLPRTPAPLGPSTAAAAPTVAYGYVTCAPDATKVVVGVWIDDPSGGSGWAEWHALPGQPNVAYFSRTLPHGGPYFVHVGCGGTPAHWELAVDSVTAVRDSGHSFTCYDSFTAGIPYSGQCRP